jgi:hypothetical protein
MASTNGLDAERETQQKKKGARLLCGKKGYRHV